MSYVPVAKMKGTLDPTIPFVTTTQVFTTAQVKIDSVNMFGGYIRAFRIVNNDTGASCGYRQGAPDAPLKMIPPATEADVIGWESYIEINPNVVTGTGFIEMDIVPLSAALIK